MTAPKGFRTKVLPDGSVYFVRATKAASRGPESDRVADEARFWGAADSREYGRAGRKTNR